MQLLAECGIKLPFEPSAFQKAIFLDTATPVNLIIEAVAGSGKSETLKIVYRILERKRGGAVIIVAFNFEIAKKMKNEGLNAKTLNALGFASVMWNARDKWGIEPTMDAEGAKIDGLIYKLFAKPDIKRFGPQVKRMVDAARGVAAATQEDVAEEGLKPLYVTSPSFWQGIIDQYNIGFSEDPTKPLSEEAERACVGQAVVFADRLLSACNRMTHTIDFADQKCFPILYNMRMRKYDAILLDEAQDMNELDRELIRRSLKTGGKFIAVGDTFQSIYAWRGADTNSMARIKEEFKCKSLPLSICYRCPESHVDLARQIVPHILARPGAPKGEIKFAGNYNETYFQPGDVVICRTNAPLVKLALRLIRARKPVIMIGRDFGKQIGAMFGRFKTEYDRRNPKPEGSELEWLSEMLMVWKDAQISKAKAAHKEKKIEAIEDMAMTLGLFVEETMGSTIQDVINDAYAVFNTENTVKHGIKLSSVHRMKGGEAERVHILDEGLMPMKSAKTPEEVQEEMNIRYVALTRSKQYLGFIESEAWQR